jgi:ABC-type branched-subunit amino acid transport system substrate-binding protein
LALSQFSKQSPEADFKLLVRDTASDESQAQQQVAEMIEAQVAAIIGPVATARVAAEAAQAAGIPLIALTQKEDIPQIGDYIFRNFMTPALQAETLVSYAVNTLGHRRFAVLYPEEPYGHRFLEAFWKQVSRFGGQVTGVESYQPEQTDFADPIKKLVGLYYPIPKDLQSLYPQLQSAKTKDRNRDNELSPIVDFDALFIPDAPHKAGLIIPQLAYYDIEQVQLLGTNLWHAPELIEIAPRFSQGAIISDGFLLEGAGGELTEFVQRYQSVFLEPPDLLAATGYDSATLLFTLLSDPRVKFRSSLKTALSTLKNFPGVTGQTAFDTQGEVHKKLFLMRVKDQGFEPLSSTDSAMSAAPAPAM